jgi:hypothetical protein
VLSYQRELDAINRLKTSNVGGPSSDFQVFTEPRGQFFLRQLFGERLSHRAVYIHLFSEQVTDQWLRDNISALHYVEVLTINSPNVTDAGLVHLRNLANLNQLGFSNTQVTDEGIEELKRALPSLKRVWR